MMKNNMKYVAFGGMCFLALNGNGVHFSTLSKESLLFCFCVIVIVHEMMTDKFTRKYDQADSYLKSRVKKDFSSEFENFAFNSKKKFSNKGGDHIIHRVIHDWKLHENVAHSVSKLIKLVVRDYILFWFVNVSKRPDFVIDVEEILTNAICTLVRRGKDFINPYMFVGDKVCEVVVRTMTLFRLASQKVKNEFPDVDKNSRQFHMLVANEFRNNGHLHIALMTSGAPSSDDKDTGREGATGSGGSDVNIGQGSSKVSGGMGNVSTTGSSSTGTGTNTNTSRSEAFKHNMVHSTYNSATDVSMEDFFDAARLANIESDYSFYVGGYLTKYLMDSKEENSKAVRHLLAEIISNIILGSVYALCSPSSVYYYIHMAVSMYRPETAAAEGSDSVLLPESSISEIDLHVGLREYFVGGVGEEKVSSSCCAMAIETAAAIVLREGSPPDEQENENNAPEWSQLPSPGHFMIRQCPPTPRKSPSSGDAAVSSHAGLSLLPAVLCLSYIRPADVPPNALNKLFSSQHWHMGSSALKALSPAFDTIGIQVSDFLKQLTQKKKGGGAGDVSCDNNNSSGCSLTYRDGHVGHVLIVVYSNEEFGLCYEMFSCSHQADLRAAMSRRDTRHSDGGGGKLTSRTSTGTSTSNSSSTSTTIISGKDNQQVSLDALPRWSSLDDLLKALKFVVPDGLHIVDIPAANVSTASLPGHPLLSLGGEASMQSYQDLLQLHIQTAENESNEKTLLTVEKNILLHHELEGAVEEYLAKKFAQENKIIQISSSDEEGKQAVKRLLEAVQNLCMHGWLKKRFVASHPMTAASAATSRDEGGRHIATTLSKMYSKILLKGSTTSTSTTTATATAHSTPTDVTDNSYEEYLNKSPVLWLWLSHIMSHCKGPADTQNISLVPGLSIEDNSLAEKKIVSRSCTCLKCHDANCYVQSMEIFLENHGGFFVNSDITLDSFFECILFCGMQTGKLVDVLEITSLLMTCEGDYSTVDAIVQSSQNRAPPLHSFTYSAENVDAVRALSACNLLVVPADQYAAEALLRSPGDSSHALSLLLPLRDHYLHYFKSTSDPVVTPTTSFSSTMSGIISSSGISRANSLSVNRSRDLCADQAHPPSPRSPTKEKKKPTTNVFKSMSQKTFSAATSLLDDISSLALQNRAAEQESHRPKHLTFSTNMDIIQVSNIKFETAEDKWHRKIGEGALFGSELQRKAEVSFILRILLRDRPPMEFLESRKIIKPRRIEESSRYSAYNIEILKYEKLSIPSSVQQVVVYYIDVYRKKSGVSCPVHVVPGSAEEKLMHSSANPLHTAAFGADATGRVRVYPHKCTCRKWTIKRRYTDFDELHKHLRSQLSQEVFQVFKLPQKAFVQVVQSSFFYAKRLMGLREYLRSLLVGLPEMAEMQTFLAPDDDEDNDSSSSPRLASSSSSPPFPPSFSLLPPDDDTEAVHLTSITNVSTSATNSVEKHAHLHSSEQPQSIPAPQLQKSTSSSTKGSPAITEKSSEHLPATQATPSSSSSSSSSSAFVSTGLGGGGGAGGVDVKHQQVVIDPRTIDLLETRVHALVNELLEVEGMSIIKKNIVTLLCKSVGIFFNGTFIKWMQHQSQPETAVAQMTSLLTFVRELFWPNDVLISFAATEQDETALKAIDHKLRTESISALNTILPNILQGHQIVERFFSLIDNPFVVKSLAYMVVDILIIDLFPELANKLSGMDSLQR